LKEDDISVCSQDTGLYDEKKKTITTGKEEEDEARNMDTKTYLQKSQKVMSNYIFVRLGWQAMVHERATI